MENIINNIKKKNLSTNKILALLSAASVLRKEKAMKEILTHLKNKKIPQVKVYETLLQTYLFAGFPTALVSLKIGSEYFPVKPKISFNKKRNFNYLGKINCKIIYGSKYEKLIENINKFSPDLAKWLVSEGYGKVFSREGLSLKQRELSIISILSALKFEEQLYSHINGAFRLKIKLKDVEDVVNNLDLIGSKSLKNFGMKVLEKYKRKSL